MAKYKVTGFAKFLMFMGISGIVLFGGTQIAEKLGFDNNGKSFNFQEVKETLKETIKEKINEKKNRRANTEEIYTETDQRLEDKLLLLIEENERLADELEECKNKKDSLVGTE